MNREETLEIINEAHDYCEKLYSGMNSLVNNITERNLIDLETYFKNILEGFNWVLEVAVFTTNMYEGKIDLEAVQQKTIIYIEAYNNLDLLLVRDIVEYELMPQVEIFYNILNKTLSSIL